MKKNQYGFAALEAVLIIVVLAIIGGLGWYVYQENKDDTKKTTTSQNSSATDDTKNPDAAEPDTTHAHVTISEWGVHAPYEGDQKLTYKLDASDSRIVHFGSGQLAALDPACNSDGAGGKIRRLAPTDGTNVDYTGAAAEEAAKTDSAYKKVGNYYYHFVHAQSGCGDTDKTFATQQHVNDLVKALVPKLTAAP